MKDEGSNNVSWTVLGIVGLIALGLVLGIVYIEYIQPESGINNGQVDQSTAEEGKVGEESYSYSEGYEEISGQPTAKFEATPTSGDAPLKVTFDASSSFDEDGEITDYNWYFGDASTGSGKTTTHLYEESGNYTARLIVTDNKGDTDRDNRAIDVSYGGQEETEGSPYEDESRGTLFEKEEEDENGYEEQSYDDSSDDTGTDDKSLAYQLATINSGYVEEGDTIVTRFEYLLDNIAFKTKNTRQEIADMSVRAAQILEEDYGVEVKLIDFMEGTNESIPPDGPKMDYAEISAAMITMLK
mgnify:CR=1 FL=1